MKDPITWPQSRTNNYLTTPLHKFEVNESVFVKGKLKIIKLLNNRYVAVKRNDCIMYKHHVNLLCHQIREMMDSEKEILTIPMTGFLRS